MLYDKLETSPFMVGEKISVPKKLVNYWNMDENNVNVKVIKVNKKTLIVLTEVHWDKIEYKINKTDVVSRNLWEIGADPFDEKFDTIRIVAFQLSSVIMSCDLLNDRREESIKMSGVTLKEMNWNPYVFDKDGKKQYYQRNFCWSLKDKQLLIESIYNSVDCGKILIRKHGWNKLEKLAKEGEKELAFKDIVDGKQRLKAIQEFIENKFSDIHGNYFGDLSNKAQHEFVNHQLFSYAEMPESTTDEEVVYQFLKMNFTGVPQSQEHLDYVKEISNKL